MVTLVQHSFAALHSTHSWCMYVCVCVYSFVSYWGRVFRGSGQCNILVILVISLHQTLDLAWQACHELDTCEAFVEVLQYILAIGNYLNAGSKQGGAYGFRLTVLPKVGEYPCAAFRDDLLADCKNLTPNSFYNNTIRGTISTSTTLQWLVDFSWLTTHPSNHS